MLLINYEGIFVLIITYWYNHLAWVTLEVTKRCLKRLKDTSTKSFKSIPLLLLKNADKLVI